MYPNEQSYMPNDSVNTDKNIQTYQLNTCVITDIRSSQIWLFIRLQNDGSGYVVEERGFDETFMVDQIQEECGLVIRIRVVILIRLD
jgi:transposase-like protein